MESKNNGSTNIEISNKNIQDVNLLWVADEFGKLYSIAPSNSYTPRQTFNIKSEAEIGDVDRMIKSSLHPSIKLILIDVFRYELIRKNEAGTLSMIESLNIKYLIKSVEYKSSILASKYPKMCFVWVLPYPPNFLQYNREAVKHKKHYSIDDKVEANWRKCSLTFYLAIKEIRNIWEQKYENINFIDLNESFFLNEKTNGYLNESMKFEVSFNRSNNIFWPSNRTIDGILPSIDFIKLFSAQFYKSLEKIKSIVIEKNIEQSFQKQPLLKLEHDIVKTMDDSSLIISKIEPKELFEDHDKSHETKQENVNCLSGKIYEGSTDTVGTDNPIQEDDSVKKINKKPEFSNIVNQLEELQREYNDKWEKYRLDNSTHPLYLETRKKFYLENKNESHLNRDELANKFLIFWNSLFDQMYANEWQKIKKDYLSSLISQEETTTLNLSPQESKPGPDLLNGVYNDSETSMDTNNMQITAPVSPEMFKSTQENEDNALFQSIFQKLEPLKDILGHLHPAIVNVYQNCIKFRAERKSLAPLINSENLDLLEMISTKLRVSYGNANTEVERNLLKHVNEIICDYLFISKPHFGLDIDSFAKETVDMSQNEVVSRIVKNLKYNAYPKKPSQSDIQDILKQVKSAQAKLISIEENSKVNVRLPIKKLNHKIKKVVKHFAKFAKLDKEEKVKLLAIHRQLKEKDSSLAKELTLLANKSYESAKERRQELLDFEQSSLCSSTINPRITESDDHEGIFKLEIKFYDNQIKSLKNLLSTEEVSHWLKYAYKEINIRKNEKNDHKKSKRSLLSVKKDSEETVHYRKQRKESLSSDGVEYKREKRIRSLGETNSSQKIKKRKLSPHLQVQYNRSENMKSSPKFDSLNFKNERSKSYIEFDEKNNKNERKKTYLEYDNSCCRRENRKSSPEFEASYYRCEKIKLSPECEDSYYRSDIRKVSPEYNRRDYGSERRKSYPIDDRRSYRSVKRSVSPKYDRKHHERENISKYPESCEIDYKREIKKSSPKFDRKKRERRISSPKSDRSDQIKTSSKSYTKVHKKQPKKENKCHNERENIPNCIYSESKELPSSSRYNEENTTTSNQSDGVLNIDKNIIGSKTNGNNKKNPDDLDVLLLLSKLLNLSKKIKDLAPHVSYINILYEKAVILQSSNKNPHLVFGEHALCIFSNIKKIVSRYAISDTFDFNDMILAHETIAMLNILLEKLEVSEEYMGLNLIDLVRKTMEQPYEKVKQYVIEALNRIDNSLVTDSRILDICSEISKLKYNSNSFNKN